MAEENAPLILLVEDDRDINMANRCALELEGYRTVSICIRFYMVKNRRIDPKG